MVEVRLIAIDRTLRADLLENGGGRQATAVPAVFRPAEVTQKQHEIGGFGETLAFLVAWAAGVSTELHLRQTQAASKVTPD